MCPILDGLVLSVDTHCSKCGDLATLAHFFYFGKAFWEPDSVAEDLARDLVIGSPEKHCIPMNSIERSC